MFNFPKWGTVLCLSHSHVEMEVDFMNPLKVFHEASFKIYLTRQRDVLCIIENSLFSFDIVSA